MDQIYGLCHPCTQKVNSHLKKQDLQIGDYLVKNRRSSVLANNVAANGNKQLPSTLLKQNGANGVGTLTKNGGTNIVVMPTQTATTTTITAGSILNGSGNKDVRHRASMQPQAISQTIKNAKMSDSLVSLDNSMNTSFGTKPKFTNDDLNNSKARTSPSQQFFKKAYTIAGTVPSMMLKQTKQAFNNISINATQASFLDENYFEFEEVGDSPGANLGTTYTKPNGAMNGHTSMTKPERKIKVTFSSIMTIVVDLVILALINLMFACDLINLVNDSGVLVIVNPLGNDEESDYPYFQTLLSIYRYKILIFVLMVILTARLAYKR